MSPYADDDSPPRDRRGHRSPQDFDQDDDFRSPSGSKPGSKSRRRPRRDQYDASDEDEASKGHRGSLPIRGRGEPGIPHPPLGEDRGKERSPDLSSHGRSDRRHNGNSDESPRSRRTQNPGNERDEHDSNDDDDDNDKYVGRRRPREDGGRHDNAAPSPRKSGRDRPRYDDDDDGNPGVNRRRSLRHPKDRDTHDAPPTRRKSLGRDFAPGDDPRRRRDRPRYPDGDDVDHARPRRRREDRPRYDDGYGTDRPRRRPRDDDHERGYRTDGRDPRRDRRKGEDRHDRDRDRRRDSARHHDDDDHRGSRRKGSKDLNGLIQTGKKHWNTVEPIAKPLLAQLAKTYLEGPGK